MTYVATRYFALDRAQPAPLYNFEHFRWRHALDDLSGVVRLRGIPPGEQAPDFHLPLATGGTVRLAALRGRPVLLRFGSFT